MSEQTPFYKLYLREELARRCENNPNYSMRSFARALNVDPAVLSRTLADKRALSYKVATRVINNLYLSPKERKIFLESVAEDQKQRGLKRSIDDQPVSEQEHITIRPIDADMFRIIGDWYHYAIQQFSFVDGFKSEPRWIAKKLGISVLETRLAIQRLLAVGLLKKDGDKLVGQDASIDTKDKSITTPALKKHQKQMLQKAIFSLENDPLPIRSMSSMTMPIDPDKIPIARKMIAEFTNNLCDILSSGDKKNVYQLSICLFPLEKREDTTFD